MLKSEIFTFQTEERLDAVVLSQEGPLPSRRVLLEEKEGRKDDARGSHEAQGSGHGGNGVNDVTCWVFTRLVFFFMLLRDPDVLFWAIRAFYFHFFYLKIIKTITRVRS